MSAKLSPKVVFSTNGIAPGSTVRAWQRFMSDVYCRLDTLIPSDDVKGTIISRSLGQLGSSYWASSSHRVIRRKEFAEQDGVERTLFIFPFNGRQEYRRDGSVQSIGPGSLPFYVVNHAEPYEVDFVDSWCEAYGISVPTELMRLRIQNLDDLCRDTRTADPLLVSTVGHICRGLIEVGSDVRADKLQALCLNLIDLMMHPTHAGSSTWRTSEGVTDFISDEAQRCIQKNLSDPALDVGVAASLCRVSVRQLQRVFQERGTTFGHELMEARLLEASKMLKAVRTPLLSVGEIAAACGFVNQAHFATRYRRRFGLSPRLDRD